MNEYKNDDNYSIVIESLTDNNIFKNIEKQKMLEGKYCDSSLKGAHWYLTKSYNNNRIIEQQTKIDEINTLLKEAPKNKNSNKKQKKLQNQKFIDLMNRLNE